MAECSLKIFGISVYYVKIAGQQKEYNQKYNILKIDLFTFFGAAFFAIASQT
jgi:hypothetical protein